MKQITEALLATFFPFACKLCQQVVENKACGVACQKCWDKYLPFQESKICQKCGYPSLNSPNINSLTLKDCIRCRNFGFSAARACGAYEGAMKESILELKNTPYLCQNLINLIKTTLTASNLLTNLNLIIPIPLYQDRLKERGFNQSILIAKEISNLTGINLDSESLAKIKSTTKHRVGMDKIDRENSLKGVFQVVRSRLIEDQTILLVDDVFTTGSTISLATLEILKAKAKEVKVFTLARAV
jgi:ComF family protein